MQRILLQGIATCLSLLSMSGAFAHDVDMNKVVYHVSEAGKVNFTLNNIRNHIKGVQNPDDLDIVLVVHGPAGKSFHTDKANDKVKTAVDELGLQGVSFNMCGNTMRAQKVEIDNIIDGFVRRDEGGVVRLAELQSKGYVYIRP